MTQPLIWIFLETSPPTVDPISWLQYGILGVVLVMLLTGWLWAKPAVDDMQKRHAEERKLWEERILPAMERIARGLETNNGVVTTNTKEISELAEILRDRKFPNG